MVVGIDAHWLEGNRTGVGRYLFNLLREWSKKGFKFPRPRLGSAEGGQVSGFKFILYFKNEVPNDLPQSDLFESKFLNVGSAAKFIHWDLWRQATKDKVDVLFCPGYIAPVFYRGKIALTLHDIIYKSHPEWFEWQNWLDKILLGWVSKISAQKAAIIFTISEFSRNEIIKYFKAAPEKVRLTYLAADTAGDINEAEVAVVKNRFGLKEKFGFYVGSVFNRRHLPEIIGAFYKIAQERPGFQLLVAGKDHTKPAQGIDGAIKNANNKLGRQAILRVDFIDDYELKLLYNACAFFIYLSDYEGFGLPPLEAMALGASVITSDATSLKEVAGQAALLIKDNSDAEEIYRAMENIIGDDALRSELKEKGQGQAARFSWEKCASATLDALLKI